MGFTRIFYFEPFEKLNIAKSFVKTLKRTFLWRSFFFSSGKKNGQKHRRTKNDKDSAFYEYTEPSKEKTPSFCGQKKRQGSPLLFLHLYKTSFIFKRPPTNDRTCMGWHTRHASIHFGAGGTFTS